jgi:ATP-dependent Clp protease, protease subunit
MHKKLLQLLRDNAQRTVSALRVEKTETDATIYLYDVIDPYFGIGAADFNKELAGLKGMTVQLRINSPGGDVFEARAIATAIAQHGDVVAHIDGLAASAATYVATAAKRVEMADGGFFMIHNAWTLAYGNKNDLRSTAELLDKVDQSIINDYAKKTGKSVDEITGWMDAETWFSAREAKDNGFVDNVFDGEKAKNKWNVSAYANAPKALTEPPANEPDWETQRAGNMNRLRLLEIG